MNNFDIKPTIEPHDHYQNAYLKLSEAVEAIKKLTPEEQHRLGCEYFGIKTKEEAIAFVLRLIQGV